MRLFKNTNIQFVKNRYYAYAISALILFVGIGGMIFRGINWSIDFNSGVALELNLKAPDASVPPVHIDKVREILKQNGYPEAEIQNVGTPENGHFLIKTQGSVTAGTGQKIARIVAENLPEITKGKDVNRDLIVQVDEVGPKVGKELRSQALLAVLLSMLLMIIYVWIRFELTFGVSAILAIFHDVFCIVGIFAITGKEFTIQVIAALLTIVGYSINDTIVIYDRIREDLRIYRKEPYEVVFNNAMNKTLSRTTITVFTTFLATLALYIFGGTVIHDFAFAILLGLILGTYSSIFVASNLVIDYYRITHHDKVSLQTLANKDMKKKR